MNDLRRGKVLLGIFTVMPIIMYVALSSGWRVPERWRNLYYLVVAAAILGFVVTVPIRESLRAERRAGIVPKRPGFAGRLEIAAEKLREHANLIDEEGAEEAGGWPVLDSYLKELQRVAKSQENYDLVPGVTTRADPARLRHAANELDAYAARLRVKGDLFHLTGVQRVYGAAIFLAMFAWGAWLMTETWSTPSLTFFGGALLVTVGVLLFVGLVKSQR